MLTFTKTLHILHLQLQIKTFWKLDLFILSENYYPKKTFYDTYCEKHIYSVLIIPMKILILSNQAFTNIRGLFQSNFHVYISEIRPFSWNNVHLTPMRGIQWGLPNTYQVLSTRSIIMSRRKKTSICQINHDIKNSLDIVVMTLREMWRIFKIIKSLVRHLGNQAKIWNVIKQIIWISSIFFCIK